MDIESVNSELQIIAAEEIESRIDLQYEEFLNEMYLQFEMEQYARDCYDLDAEYYGRY